MPFNIAFYIHHHGSGHVMRAIAIASQLTDAKVTFLGSALRNYAALIPASINCIHLDLDIPVGEDKYFRPHECSALHYAPLNVSGQLSRVQALTTFFNTHANLLLVVDVSVEVAMLATLCGIPHIIVRQHGKRNDLPHLLAYRQAQALLAPYSEMMLSPEDEWITRKTYFAGGLCRFEPEEDISDPEERILGVVIGNGGTSIDQSFLLQLAQACPDWTIHVLGQLEGEGNLPVHVHIHGQLDDPRPVLRSCNMILGNAGHNTVMEIAALSKRFIVIPESRPFEEQEQKATILQDNALATVIYPKDLDLLSWKEIFEMQRSAKVNWAGVIDPDAAKNAARFIIEQHQSFYQD